MTRARGRTGRYVHATKKPPTATVTIGKHVIVIERLERLRWRVSVDGRRFAVFCSESRARAAGRQEARRLDHHA
jgi:hypothetical protein